MVAAGPLANAILAVSAWAWIHNSEGSFRFLSVPTSLAALLFWSNAVSAAVSLFPTMVITAHGRIPNDGLALIRLVRGVSTTSEEMEPHSSSSESPSRRLRFVVQLIVWIAGVVCMGIALLLLLSFDDSPSQTVSRVIGFLLAALGLTLFWLGVRAGKPWRLSTAGRRMGITGYNLEFRRQFSREVLAARSAFAPQMLASLDAALQAKDWSRVLAESERLSANQHGSPALVLQGSEALLELNRHHEAAAEAEKALGQSGLGWALQTSACLLRFRALLRNRQLELVNAAANDWCSTDVPLPGKLVLLDGIACEILYRECRDQLPAAESWARKAVALCPMELSIKGTLGSILAELGRYDEAEPLLRETYDQSPSPNDQRICAFYLALIARKRNQTSRIHAFVTEAKEATDQPWLLARLEQEFPDLSDCGNQIH
jgi:tetratricopeptide (TPR) repeat protein